MKTENAGVLRIRLTGNLDTVTATEWYKNTAAHIAEHSAADLWIDCSELLYVSSTGLRMMLRIAQSGCRVHCTDVSRDLLDVFEVTGFTSILDVRRAYREIEVSDDSLIARGTVGTVYRLDEDRIVKVFKREVTIDLIEREHQYAQRVRLVGIPTVISYDIVRVGDCYGIIFEMGRPEEFSRRLRENPDQFDALADQYADLLKRVNQTQMKPGSLPDAKAIYHRYIDGSAAFLTEDERAALHGLVDSVPNRDTMLHGDYHANNVMFQDDELMLIDLGDISQGHPVFDLASVYVSHILVGSYQPDLVRAGMGIDVQTSRALWNRVLHSSFPGEQEEALRRKEALIRRFAYLKLAVIYTIAPGLENYLNRQPMEDARKELFPYIDCLKAELRQGSI